MEAMASQTELQQLLQQCLLDVRQQIAARRIMVRREDIEGGLTHVSMLGGG